jgi:hypothetical protein
MIFIDKSQSNNDKASPAFIRSRRQLDLKEYINACKDKCITSQSNAVSQHIYTLKELRVS